MKNAFLNEIYKEVILPELPLVSHPCNYCKIKQLWPKSNSIKIKPDKNWKRPNNYLKSLYIDI